MLQALAVTLIAFLAEACKGLVGRVLVALGIGAVTAVGVQAALSSVVAMMTFSGVPSQMLSALNAVGLPWFLSALVSAVSTRMVLKGLTSTGVSFWVMRRSIG